MTRPSLFGLLACALLVVTATVAASTPEAAAPPQSSPYAGMESREIKALSSQEIDDLTAGRGMGFAMVAELNGYPGPKHLLELAEPLELAPEQVRAIRAVYDEMHERAVELGQRLVSGEQALDRAFAAEAITEMDLEQRLTALAALRADLRFAHVRAHLAAREIVTAEQRAHYDRLRGYGGHEGHGGHSGGHGHHAPESHGEHGGHSEHGGHEGCPLQGG